MSNKSFEKLEGFLRKKARDGKSKHSNKIMKKLRNRVIRRTPNEKFDKSIPKRYYGWEY